MSDDGSFDNGEKRNGGRFQPGNPGGGRPKGSRNKLAEAFISDLFEKWQASGPDVIDRVIEQRPHEFIKVIASLMPKHLKVTEDRAQLTDEQRAIRLLGLFRRFFQEGHLAPIMETLERKALN